MQRLRYRCAQWTACICLAPSLLAGCDSPGVTSAVYVPPPVYVRPPVYVESATSVPVETTTIRTTTIRETPPPPATAVRTTTVMTTAVETVAPAGYEPYTQAELAELTGPIALYPDPLLAQVLAGATYPQDIIEADQFVKDHADDPDLYALVDRQPWDPSVQALTRYPSVLATMSAFPDWTEQLGAAFLYQQADVMQAVQNSRQQAHTLGHLTTTEQQTVIVEQKTIRIEPAYDSVIYVPYYAPEVVFVRPRYLYAGPVVTFSVGFRVGSWLWLDCDWSRRRLYHGGWYDRHHPRHHDDRGRHDQHDGRRNDSTVIVNNNVNVNVNNNTHDGAAWTRNAARPAPRIERKHTRRETPRTSYRDPSRSDYRPFPGDANRTSRSRPDRAPERVDRVTPQRAPRAVEPVRRRPPTPERRIEAPRASSPAVSPASTRRASGESKEMQKRGAPQVDATPSRRENVRRDRAPESREKSPAPRERRMPSTMPQTPTSASAERGGNGRERSRANVNVNEKEARRNRGADDARPAPQRRDSDESAPQRNAERREPQRREQPASRDRSNDSPRERRASDARPQPTAERESPPSRSRDADWKQRERSGGPQPQPSADASDASRDRRDASADNASGRARARGRSRDVSDDASTSGGNSGATSGDGRGDDSRGSHRRGH